MSDLKPLPFTAERRAALRTRIAFTCYVLWDDEYPPPRKAGEPAPKIESLAEGVAECGGLKLESAEPATKSK